MNLTNQAIGNWHELKGMIKEKWGDLTNDEVEQIAGEREKLIGALMRKYDIAKEDAEKEVSGFWH